MLSGLHSKLPKWSRWSPIIKVTPSGKTLFVCLVCGRSSPAPDKTCPAVPHPDGVNKHRFQHFVETEYPDAGTCDVIEEAINNRIQLRAEPGLVIELYENRLRSWVHRHCDFCRGFGCQVCFGAGRIWSSGKIEPDTRS